MTKRTTDAEFLALVEGKMRWAEGQDAAHVELHFADVERLVEMAKKGLKRRKTKRKTLHNTLRGA